MEKALLSASDPLLATDPGLSTSPTSAAAARLFLRRDDLPPRKAREARCMSFLGENIDEYDADLGCCFLVPLGVAGGVSVDVAAMQLMDGVLWRANAGALAVDVEARADWYWEEEEETLSGDGEGACLALALRWSAGAPPAAGEAPRCIGI